MSKTYRQLQPFYSMLQIHKQNCRIFAMQQ